jgi:putative intracellular protease/amidase
MKSILMILTSATQWTQKDGSQLPTGFWAEEFVVPHKAFEKAGFEVKVATPEGRPAVVDQTSLSPRSNGGDESKVTSLLDYLRDHAKLLNSPLAMENFDASKYCALIVPGGHGPMQDLAVHSGVGRALAAAATGQDVVIGGLCHGPASFLSAGTATEWAFKGRRVTAFSNIEEDQVGLASNAPWLLEDRLRAAGADFRSSRPFLSHVVVDGNLITGQNPQSAEEFAHAVIRAVA